MVVSFSRSRTVLLWTDSRQGGGLHFVPRDADRHVVQTSKGTVSCPNPGNRHSYGRGIEIDPHTFVSL